MRKAIVAIVSALVLLAAAPAAAAPVCGDLVGLGRIQASGAGTAEGRAVVLWNGTIEVVPITSQLTSPTTGIQQWDFDDGLITVEESATLTPLFGSVSAVESDVDVVAGGSGVWSYHGTFNSSTLIARFVVHGTLCIDA